MIGLKSNDEIQKQADEIIKKYPRIFDMLQESWQRGYDHRVEVHRQALRELGYVGRLFNAIFNEY